MKTPSMAERGDLYWVDLGPVVGSAPAKRRPVVVIQSAAFNRSRLATAIVAAVTSNTDRASHPGNVFLPATLSGLTRDSAVNVTSVATIDKSRLEEHIGTLPPHLLAAIDDGLRLVLSL